MAKNGTHINNIFRPSENGHLGEGMIGFTYKGKNKYSKSVSIEFNVKYHPRRYIAKTNPKRSCDEIYSTSADIRC